MPCRLLRPLLTAVSVGLIGASCSVQVRRSDANAGRASESQSAFAAVDVMSFNLRYSNPADGPNAWPLRKERVAAAIRFHRPALLGVQEALASMLDELDMLLPGFGRVGVGRTDGATQGEYSAILYDTTRLAIEESGTFWLSPTPEVVGSRGWDAALERIATWARVRDRRTGCIWVHVNTHFDHVGDSARVESARLIRRRLGELAGGRAITMTGDFNADPSHPVYATLTRRDDAATAAAGAAGAARTTGAPPSPVLHDALLASSTPHYGPMSTWNAFREIEDGKRIDFVFVSEGVQVLRHGILTDRWDGRFLSDHLPVLATVVPCAS